MRLANRVTVATIGLVLATAVAFGVVAYVLIGRTVLPFELEAIRGHARDVATSLADAVRPAVTDALVLGGLPVASRILSAEATEDERAGFVDLLSSLLEAHPEYLQARLIGTADGGREVVRVERAPDGAVRVVPEPELQRKGAREYFVEAMAAPPGGVYGSPIELNREHGVVQDPPVPVARFATPVPDSSGAPAGIAILNVDLREPLARARVPTHERGEVVIVGASGTFLVHPERELEFILGAATDDVFPMEAVRTAGPDRPAVEVMSPSGVCLVAGVATVELPSGRELTVVETVPLTVASATTGAVWRSSLVAGIVATLVAIVLSIVISRALSRPLSRLQSAIDRYPESAFRGVDTGPEEVRELGAAFGSMIRRVERHESQLRDELDARQRAEEELSRHLDRVRLLASALESASDAVVLKSLDGTVIHCNAAAERLFGYPAAELVGGSIEKIVPEDLREELDGISRRIRRGDAVHDLVTQRLRADGRRIDVAMSVSPVRSAAGQLIGATAISKDVTERVAEEERFRQAFEASPSGMIIVDQSGAMVMVNPEAARQFGYDRGELRGEPVERLIPERYREAHVGHRRSYGEAPSARRMGSGRELFGVRKDGVEFPIEVGLNPIRVRDSSMVMCIVSDITVREQAQAEARRYAAELERSNEELEQFAYLASHDLQEPLRMVASYADLFYERYRDQVDDRGRKFLDYILEGAERMRTMISDLLSYSRVSTQAGETEPTDVAGVMRDVVADLAATIRESGAKVEWADLPVVQADRRQFRQLLRNLVGNALKFRRPDVPARVTVSGEADGALATIRVEDNGIGIDPAAGGRLFQMFQRLHDRQTYPGNGIGLAVARKIVERHGGTLGFEPAAEHGTIFRFTVPVSEDVS